MWKELAPDYYNDDMVSNYPWLMLLQTICPVTCEWSAGYCTAEDDEKDGPPPGMGPAPTKTVPVGCVCEAFTHPTLGAAPAGCPRGPWRSGAGGSVSRSAPATPGGSAPRCLPLLPCLHWKRAP